MVRGACGSGLWLCHVPCAMARAISPYTYVQAPPPHPLVSSTAATQRDEAGEGTGTYTITSRPCTAPACTAPACIAPASPRPTHLPATAASRCTLAPLLPPRGAHSLRYCHPPAHTRSATATPRCTLAPLLPPRAPLLPPPQAARVWGGSWLAAPPLHPRGPGCLLPLHRCPAPMGSCYARAVHPASADTCSATAAAGARPRLCYCRCSSHVGASATAAAAATPAPPLLPVQPPRRRLRYCRATTTPAPVLLPVQPPRRHLCYCRCNRHAGACATGTPRPWAPAPPGPPCAAPR